MSDHQDNDNYGDSRDRDSADGTRRRGGKRRFCRFCADRAAVIDFKDPQALRYFVTERGKIVPRRISGTCAYHQRKITIAIKQARNIALLPFTASA
jgi:small subunit ribosomal protein S18